jgi:hypothetical protein
MKAMAKCMNLLWVSHFQKVLDQENVPITVIALHPGVIATGSFSIYIQTYP